MNEEKRKKLGEKTLPLIKESREKAAQFNYAEIKLEQRTLMQKTFREQGERLENNLQLYVKGESFEIPEEEKDLLEHKLLKPLVVVHLAASAIIDGSVGKISEPQMKKMVRIRNLMKQIEKEVRHCFNK
ncbi:hypothetical protein ACFL52_01125 [Candidatus Margulisiibacteriota bacterium]